MEGPTPTVDAIYEDSTGRTLKVEYFCPTDPAGREVRGVITHPKAKYPRLYSCTLELWREIWHSKEVVGTFKQ